MATEVILTQPIQNLGVEADLVKVRPGYARNYLIPQGKAMEVNASSLRHLNSLKAKRAEREAKELNESEELVRRINKLKLQFELETGTSGKAFGSVTANDIAQKLSAELGGIEIDRHKIQLERAIKESGETEVTYKVHSDVTAKFKVIVASPAAAAEAASGDAKAGE